MYTKLSKTMAFEKSVLLVAYGLYNISLALPLSLLPFTCGTHIVCLQCMYHNVFRYEYLIFQTQIIFHKQHILDTNIIQSEYAVFFSFQYINVRRPSLDVRFYNNRLCCVMENTQRTMLPLAGHWHPAWSKKQNCRIKLIWYLNTIDKVQIFPYCAYQV